MGRLGALLALLYLAVLSQLVQLTASYEDNKQQLLGVRPDRRSLYELAGEQNFKCLDGSRTIPKQFVNDDYCDCLDASDEPGTSACPHGQFFCKNEGYIEKLIPSAWVNDGLCDCCDASDEYNSNSTCANTCAIDGEIYRQEQERNREIADKGSAIRSQYKEQAKQMKEQNSQLLEQYKRELSEKEQAIKKIESELNSDFGPGQVFMPLKGKCFKYKDREYTYSLCLFESATQESTSGMQTELGRWTSWAGPVENPYSRQRYEGGMQCWNGPTRSAVINIACGVEDRIVGVSEPAKCEYVYDFITPAACPDLDPPEENQPEEANIEPQQDPQGDRSQLEQEETSQAEEPTTFEQESTHAPSETHDEL